MYASSAYGSFLMLSNAGDSKGNAGDSKGYKEKAFSQEV